MLFKLFGIDSDAEKIFQNFFTIFSIFGHFLTVFGHFRNFKNRKIKKLFHALLKNFIPDFLSYH